MVDSAVREQCTVHTLRVAHVLRVLPRCPDTRAPRYLSPYPELAGDTGKGIQYPHSPVDTRYGHRKRELYRAPVLDPAAARAFS